MHEINVIKPICLTMYNNRKERFAKSAADKDKAKK